MVEHDLAKVGVASSSLVFRSFFFAIRQKGTKTSGCETQFCRPKSVAQHIGVIERRRRESREVLMQARPDGGIGRRVRFRCACREVCRFESCSGHGDLLNNPINWGERRQKLPVYLAERYKQPHTSCRTRRAGGEIGIHATLRG